MTDRLQALGKNIPAGAALIRTEVNRRYYTGFPSSAGTLVVTGDRAVFFIDGRYVEAARQAARGCEVVEEVRLSDQLPELLQELGIRSALCETEIPVSQLTHLQQMLPGIEVQASAELTDAITRERGRKDAGELANIVAAQRIAERSFEYILNEIKPKRTEKELALALEFHMRSHGAEASSFDIIFVSGAKSSMPHGVPSDKQLEPGDFITMDFGATVDGYHSDMTRTVALGHVSDEQRAVYQTVLDAKHACTGMIAAGMRCDEVDKAARDVIGAAGYGEYFTHGVGHGVGLEIHEYPRVSRLVPDPLEAGAVVTVEPGIYLLGRFGVRIEDMVSVREGGCDNLTRADDGLIIL